MTEERKIIEVNPDAVPYWYDGGLLDYQYWLKSLPDASKHADAEYDELKAKLEIVECGRLEWKLKANELKAKLERIDVHGWYPEMKRLEAEIERLKKGELELHFWCVKCDNLRNVMANDHCQECDSKMYLIGMEAKR